MNETQLRAFLAEALTIMGHGDLAQAIGTSQEDAATKALLQALQAGGICDATSDVVYPGEELFSLRHPLIALDKDIKAAARRLTYKEARWIVNTYYIQQDGRQRAAGQLRQIKKAGDPNELLTWVYQGWNSFEAAVKRSLGEFAAEYKVGQWLQAQFGIGPVLSAGFMANIDIRKAPTVGHIWRFFGLDPSLVWLGKDRSAKLIKAIGLKTGQPITPEQIGAICQASGQHPVNIQRVWEEGYKPMQGDIKKGTTGMQAWLSARPWNDNMKSFSLFCFGETQVKFSDIAKYPKSYYGPLFAAKKQEMLMKNEAGELRHMAQREIARCEADPSLLAKMKEKGRWAYWQDGKLCPQHLHEYPRRWMVKLFISHLHEVMYWDYYGKAPPAPFVFTHPECGDHRHKIEPPMWHGVTYSGRSLRDLYGEE